MFPFLSWKSVQTDTYLVKIDISQMPQCKKNAEQDICWLHVITKDIFLVIFTQVW